MNSTLDIISLSKDLSSFTSVSSGSGLWPCKKPWPWLRLGFRSALWSKGPFNSQTSYTPLHSLKPPWISDHPKDAWSFISRLLHVDIGSRHVHLWMQSDPLISKWTMPFNEWTSRFSLKSGWWVAFPIWRFPFQFSLPPFTSSAHRASTNGNRNNHWRQGVTSGSSNRPELR